MLVWDSCPSNNFEKSLFDMTTDLITKNVCCKIYEGQTHILLGL